MMLISKNWSVGNPRLQKILLYTSNIGHRLSWKKRYVLSGRIVGKRLIGILKMKREKLSVGKGV